MKLAPSNQDNGKWRLVDETGKKFRREFDTKQEAVQWALSQDFEVHETQGGSIDQGGQGGS